MAQAGRSIGIGLTAMRCRHGHKNEVVIAAKLPAVRADVDFPSRRLSVTSPLGTSRRFGASHQFDSSWG
jgi:hypothetical protein